MAQYTHKIIGLSTMAFFLAITSLDLNTHLHRVTLSQRSDNAKLAQAHVAMATQTMATQTMATHKIRQAISD